MPNPFEEELARRGQDNPFRAEIERRTQGDSGAGSAFMDAAGTRLANNILGIPRGIGTTIAFGGAALETGVNKLLGNPADFSQTFEQQKQQLPASAFLAIPSPTVQDIAAGLTVPFGPLQGRSFGEQFQAKRSEIAERDAKTKEAHPIAVGAGEIAGDVATLLIGKAPIAKAINRAETTLMTQLPKQLSHPNVQFAVNRTIASRPLRLLARGAGRTLETGLETAALDIVKGNDPTQTAMYAMGGQAAGSLSLQAMKSLGAKGTLGLAAAAFIGGSMIQYMKEAAPGGKEQLLDSLETGFEKVMLALALGAMSGVAGAGRLRDGEWAKHFPVFMESVATVPRGAMISLLQKWQGAGAEERKRIESALADFKLPEDAKDKR